MRASRITDLLNNLYNLEEDEDAIMGNLSDIEQD